MLGCGGRDEPEDALDAAPRAEAAVPAASASSSAYLSGDLLIALSHDGNVTLRVEHQPLERVLDEIARQGGRDRLQVWACGIWACGTAGSYNIAASAPDPMEASAPQLQAARGAPLQDASSPTEGLQDLLRPASHGASTEGDMMKIVNGSEVPDTVRLLALESALGPLSGDPAMLRQVLEWASHVPSAAVRAEAKRRLDALNGNPQADASDGQ